MQLVIPPTAEPVSLAEVKDQLGIATDDTDRDAVIGRRISQARQWAEDYLARSLMPQTWEARLNAFPGEIELRRPPVASVAAIEYIDGSSILQTVSALDYELDTFPTLPLIRPAYGRAWPSGVRGHPGDVRVRYLAGYAVTAIGTAKTVTAITQAAPGVLTSAAHGFSNGDLVRLDVAGMSELNGALYRVYAKATDTFQLANLTNSGGINTAAMGAFTSGTATRVQVAVPLTVIEALCLLVGHWTNYQARLEGEGFITRVPMAIHQMLDKERIVAF